MTDKRTDGDVALPPGLEENIAQAWRGDHWQWGRLYGLAAALIRAGLPLPEPLQSAIADRLGAMADFLNRQHIGDVRAIADVVSPCKGPRRLGPRARTDRVDAAARAAADMLEADRSYGRRRSVIERVAAVADVPTESVDKRVNNIRAKRRR